MTVATIETGTDTIIRGRHRRAVGTVAPAMATIGLRAAGRVAAIVSRLRVGGRADTGVIISRLRVVGTAAVAGRPPRARIRHRAETSVAAVAVETATDGAMITHSV
jgi:hypothetical protein